MHTFYKPSSTQREIFLLTIFCLGRESLFHKTRNTENEKTSNRTPPPQGMLVDAGGHKLHLKRSYLEFFILCYFALYVYAMYSFR